MIKADDLNDQLIIALEPEAASIYCQSLQLRDSDSLSSTDSNGQIPTSGSIPKCSSLSSSSQSLLMLIC